MEDGLTMDNFFFDIEKYTIEVYEKSIQQRTAYVHYVIRMYIHDYIQT